MSKNSSFLRLNYGDGTDTNTLNDTLNEIQRNYLIMSEEDQRKSSLNYFELLRLGNFLNNRNSNTSLIEINNKDKIKPTVNSAEMYFSIKFQSISADFLQEKRQLYSKFIREITIR